ncbi:AT-hook-containing transcription factor isoform X2 [Echeneis naucrates]|uniref:AT-hook-containing transcription factor isoform X2 n=1 Tax=Echeneis naucrates TaxID=173247 RepID=UPI001113CB05|nr:microtubule organization protein AKNA isoform X2 [Echeneis naucrates]
MEKRRNTTAGVLFWTPAPAHTSPTSSVISGEWEDEDGELAGKEDDFVSQMDDNGIIGLLEFGETYKDTDAELNPACYARPVNPEAVDLYGCARDTAPEEWNYNLSEHLSFTEAVGEDLQILAPCDGTMSYLKAQTQSEEVRERKEELKIEQLSETDKYLGITEGEDRKLEEKRNRNRNSKTEFGCMKGLAESSNGAQSCGAHTPVVESAQLFHHNCTVTQCASALTTAPFPHLLHFTSEEFAASPGIEAETFPEMGFIESLPESHSSHLSLIPCPCPQKSEQQEVKVPQTAVVLAKKMANCSSEVCNGPLKGPVKLHEQPHYSQGKKSQPSPEAIQSKNCSLSTIRTDSIKSRGSIPNKQKMPRARNEAVEVNGSRNVPLSYSTPDFSQVEPRVRFPKGGYKPPKSRNSSKRESLYPEPPIVFKSPADIVKEVLLNTTDSSPTSSDSIRQLVGVPTSTVPQEFRCRQQATTLLEQLQEDYSRLLTKHAEAENTIDRLRLEAKVNLYSDPPKPGHSVHSGLSQNASRVMTLDFPQAQRAETNSSSLPANGHSAHQSIQVQQLSKILYNEADNFLQQLQTFKDFLKLKPYEKIKSFSQLVEALNSLERGYLLASNEHKLLQQRGAEINHFDPERELEGLIYQCGLHMDELEEQVEQMQQEQPTCEAPPSQSPQPTPSAPSEGGETLTYLQRAPVPLLMVPEQAAGVEVSSVKEECVEEEAEVDDEDTVDALYFKPLDGKHREEDFLSATIGSDKQPAKEETEGQGERPGNLEVHESFPHRKERSIRSSPPAWRASNQAKSLAASSSHHRLEIGKSHSSSLSSLGDISALERRNLKLEPGNQRVLSQDGIISPETDSGFVGSESNHLTPAAAPTSLHRRVSQSVSVRQKGTKGKHQTGLILASSLAASQSHSRTASESREVSQLGPEQPNRSRRRRTFSCSPQRWANWSERTDRADSGATYTVSVDGQSHQYAESITSLNSSYASSSPTAWYHHGDSLGALGIRMEANRNEVLQALQAEVTTLTKRLESCLGNKPLSPVRADPSAQVKYHHYTSTPHISSGERFWTDVRRRRREGQMVDEVQEESTMRRAARERSPCAERQKPQHDILTCSVSGPSTLQFQPQVSRYTQTSTATPESCCSHTAHRRETHPKQRPVVSIQVTGRADEPDGRLSSPLCLKCSSNHQRQSERPDGGNRESPPCCHHCGCCEPHRNTKPARQRDSDAPIHTSCQLVESPNRAARNTPAPALLQCMPVCPPSLMMYSLPLYMSPSNSTSPASGVKGHGEVRGRLRRSLSTDKQLSLDSSLNRAIRAARSMKSTSKHMARSLATGLHYQELLVSTHFTGI